MKMKATQFFKHLSTAPILGKNAYLFAMEQTTKELDIRSLNAELNQISNRPEPIKAEKPPRSIDLHIEQLHPDPDGLSNSEKMRIQLEIFEKKPQSGTHFRDGRDHLYSWGGKWCSEKRNPQATQPIRKY